MGKFSEASSNMKLLYTALVMILILAGFVLYSVMGAEDVMVQNTEGFLSEQSSNYGRDIEKSFYTFESDINYAAGKGAFNGLMKGSPISEEKRNDMIRVYAQHATIIRSLNLYNRETNYSISLDNSNYFELVKSTTSSVSLPYKVNKNLMSIEGIPYMIVPIYNEKGEAEANLAVGLDINGFISEMAKNHSVGDGAYKWYMNSQGEISVVSGDEINPNQFLSEGVVKELREKLNYGFRDLIFHKATFDGSSQKVISSMYPVNLGNIKYAVGFTLLESSVLKDIRYKIIQIGLLFTIILILISYIFYIFLRVEIRAKKEMADARQTVSHVLQNLPTGVIIYHEVGGIIRVNKAAAKLLGIEADREVMTEPLDRFIVTEEDDEGVIRRYIKHGTNLLPIVSEVTEMMMNNQNVKIMSFADISEIEQARKLAVDSSRIKSEFIANISHEIRTPMNGVLASVEILEDTVLDDEQQEFIGIIKKSANNLMVIINDILDISKIESGKMTLESIPFNLREQLELVVDHFGLKSQSKGIEMVLNLDPQIPEILVGDPVRLTQIINNMVGNAVKFTEEGSIVITVSIAKHRAGSKTLRLKLMVADTGIGIPVEKQTVIFNSFTQVDGSITRKYGGTGLGTSISKELVELMKGKIWVESPNVLFGEGKGSIFHIEVEVMVADEQPEPPKFKLQPKCLLIEKSDHAAKAALNIFKSIHLDVAHVSSSRDAVRAVADAYEQKQRYDLIFCDYETAMADDNLFEILMNIDGRGENDNNIDHVVALLQMANSDQLAKVKYYGTNYINKPLKLRTLMDTIKLIPDTNTN